MRDPSGVVEERGALRNKFTGRKIASPSHRSPSFPIMQTRRIVVTAAVLTLTLGLGQAYGHDFWLVPDVVPVDHSGAYTVRGQSSTRFPSSESAVPVDRIADARVLTANADERLTDFSVSGKSLLVTHRPAGTGQRVIALALQVRTQRLSAEAFRGYLALEGATDVVTRYDHQGGFPSDSVTMRSAKFAKTLVQVGAGGSPAFSRSAGQTIELVPLEDPLGLRAGDTAHVRVLFRGIPLPMAQVHAGSAPVDSASRVPDISYTADAMGVVAVPIPRDGLWNLRTAFAAPARSGTVGEWDVDWTTFVFRTATGLPGRSAGEVALPARHRSDSADVIRTVHAFRAALTRGDSAAALALLAPDVSIIESGGVERLAGYRSHHLPEDIAFARAVPTESAPPQVTLAGETAWVTSTSTVQGIFQGRTINSAGAELMVLVRDTSGRWRIRAIHWSSRRRT